MPIFKALHILSMIAMVTIEIGSEFLYAFAISRRDVRGLATVHRLLEQARAGPASIAALVSGVVFGLLTAATGGFDFLDGWLIAAYVLLIVLIVTTTVFLRPALRLGRAAVEAEEGHGASEDVVREMAADRLVVRDRRRSGGCIRRGHGAEAVLRPAGGQSRPPLCPDPKPLPRRQLRRRDHAPGDAARTGRPRGGRR